MGMFEKSFFHLEEDIFVGFIYLPLINSSFTNAQEYHSFEMLEKDTCKFKSKGKIVLLGDFNSITGTLPDFSVTDDDKYTPAMKMNHFFIVKMKIFVLLMNMVKDS